LQIHYTIITKRQVQPVFGEKDLYIFIDQDELRATQCLHGIDMMTTQKRERCITYRDLINKIMRADILGYVLENKHQKVNEKATVLLAELKKRGIKSICINGAQFAGSEYAKKVKFQLSERLKISPISMEPPQLTGLAASNFWCELYQLEDYRNGTVEREVAESYYDYRRKDISGKYCNARNGRRVTCFQPKDYIGTIYFLGPCTFYGYFSEDQYTIESFLQKRLLEEGYLYRVENCATPIGRNDSDIDGMLKEIGMYNKNDIVIYLSQCGSVIGVENRRLWDICEEQDIPSEWMTNGPLHINYKACHSIADSIFEMLSHSYLKTDKHELEYQQEIDIDFHNIMKDYVYHKYLSLYFGEFMNDDYDSVGAIVMNCNPFSKGHRYLIEQACRQVKFLIIFVVEENASLFSFEERYAMVKEGVRDLDNVMAVPSGEFILSNNTFGEYFAKRDTGVIDLSAEHDINIFADYIAKPLRITHRFVGEEPFDMVTGVYNQVMKEILPQKGIELVEIPRMDVEGEIVSASRVRNYMECGEYRKAFRLLPDTTISFLRD
ncbi:MAG: adenylyltransferase/cytidyltransferase family protein, partial [Lachnospiraceae bacterium]|nr:adenylyltransferase/cytidyltransferase family protein [Lachnospiraceae bacterium]